MVKVNVVLDVVVDDTVEVVLDVVVDDTVEVVLDVVVDDTVEVVLDVVVDDTVEVVLDVVVDDTVEVVLDVVVENVVDLEVDVVVDDTVEVVLDVVVDDTVEVVREIVTEVDVEVGKIEVLVEVMVEVLGFSSAPETYTADIPTGVDPVFNIQTDMSFAGWPAAELNARFTILNCSFVHARFAPTPLSYCFSLEAACPLTNPKTAAPAMRVMAITAIVLINSETPLLSLEALLPGPAPLGSAIRTGFT